MNVWTDQPREHEVLPKLPPLLGVSQLFVDAKIYLCIAVALWARSFIYEQRTRIQKHMYAHVTTEGR